MPCRGPFTEAARENVSPTPHTQPWLKSIPPGTWALGVTGQTNDKASELIMLPHSRPKWRLSQRRGVLLHEFSEAAQVH